MRASRSLLVVPLVVVAALLTGVPSATAAGTGSISGRLMAQPTGGAAAPYSSGGVQVYYNETSDSFGSEIVEPYPTIGADGRFTVANLADGWYWLRAYAGDYATEYYDDTFHYSTATPIHVTGGAVTLPEDIVLEEAGAVVGTVRDRAGDPIPDASVTFSTVEGGGGIGTTTGADGRFDTRNSEYLELVPGTYLMEVSSWGFDLDEPVYRTTSTQVVVGPDQVVTEDVVLDERPSAVVTVLDPAGEPVPEARLVIQHRDPELTDGAWRPIQSGPHNTDATGRYRFVDGIAETRFQVLLPEGYDGPAVPEWWKDAYALETARSLTFPEGVALRRDLTVQLGTAPAVVAAAPRITGTPRAGNVLTAVPGSWGPAGVALTYAWTAGGRTVGTGPTLRVTNALAGQRVGLTVSGSVAGAEPVSRAASPTAAVTGTLTAATPRIAGKAKVGKRLTVRAGSWGPGKVTLKVVWLRNGTKVGSGSSYRLTGQDAGRRISVRVTGTCTHFAPLTRTSARTGKVKR
jgi:hypothetical protein